MDCEHYEVEIEKRARGATAPEESAALDLHLAGCSACRALELTVQELETAMHANTTHELSTVDWNRMERGLSAITAGYRKALTRIAFAALPMIALITWATAEPGDRLATAVASTVIVAAILVVGLVVRRRTDAKVAMIAGRGSELVAAYSEELDVTIRRLRHGRVYLPVFGAMWLAIGVSKLVAGAGVAAASFWIGIGVLLLVQAALAHRQLRRRLRERAELG
jgi:hypothetical protein